MSGSNNKNNKSMYQYTNTVGLCKQKQRSTSFFSRSSSSEDSDHEKYKEMGSPTTKRRRMCLPKEAKQSSVSKHRQQKMTTTKRTVSPRTQPEIIDLLLSSDDDDGKIPARHVSSSPPPASGPGRVMTTPKQCWLKTAAPGQSTVEQKRSTTAASMEDWNQSISVAIPRNSMAEPFAARTTAALISAVTAASSQTLGEWLQNITSEELEHLNAEAMRNSKEQSSSTAVPQQQQQQQQQSIANTKTLRESYDIDGNITRFLNKTKTTNNPATSISQDDDNDPNATAVSEQQADNTTMSPYTNFMADMSREEIEALNEQAIKLAMEGPTEVDYPYTLDEFKRDFIETAERSGQLDQEELEHSKAVRDSNTKISKDDSTEQEKAQYGRTMLTSGQRLFSAEIGNLKRGDCFCDIGSGIGNLVHQAAYTIGCEESRGIELIDGRFRIGEAFDQFYEDHHKKVSAKVGAYPSLKKRFVGQIKLRQGGLQEEVHRDFLTKGVDLLYCNNYNDVFGVRANSKVGYCLDDYIAGLLTQLAPGAKLVTLSEIRRLPPPVTQVNRIRKANGLQEHAQASFYELKTVEDEGGEDKLTFTEMAYTIYIYTRTGDATFLCDDACCAYAANATPILAYTTIGEGHGEKLVSVVECPGCKTPRRARRQRKGVDNYKPTEF